MSKRFKNGKLLVGKVNESGNIIETLCVEIERVTGKPQDKKTAVVLYPLLTFDDKYIFENIDIAVKSGLKKEDILKEIKKYLINKSNYRKQYKKEEKKTNYSNEDLYEMLIKNVTTLEDIAKIYYILSKRKSINCYKDEILKRLNEVAIAEPFFFTEFNKYRDIWGNENSDFNFNLYMFKIELILEKYRDVKYDEIIDFDNVRIKKGDYLEELLYNFIEQWQDYGLCYNITWEEENKFFSLYSKFEYAQFNSYVIAILFNIYGNSLLDEENDLPENIKVILLAMQEKVKNKIKEIHFPMVSFEYSYMQALENNNYIDFAKASLQANSKELKSYIGLLEKKFKSFPLNIEDTLLLILCLFEKHENKLEWDINIRALTTILDNYNLKNNSNFKRIHHLFYQSLLYYLDDRYITKSSLLEIKKLYENNCSKYNEQIKKEFDSISRYYM